MLFEVLIGKADLILAGAASGSFCGVLPRAVIEHKKASASFWHSCFHLKVTFYNLYFKKVRERGQPAQLTRPLVPERPTRLLQSGGLGRIGGENQGYVVWRHFPPAFLELVAGF